MKCVEGRDLLVTN